MNFTLAVRWRIAVMLCLITTINYVDRQALAVAAPVLMDEFSLSNTQYGWLGWGFLWAYALGQLLTGPVIDRLGAKRALSLAVIACSCGEDAPRVKFKHRAQSPGAALDASWATAQSRS